MNFQLGTEGLLASFFAFLDLSLTYLSSSNQRLNTLLGETLPCSYAIS